MVFAFGLLEVSCLFIVDPSSGVASTFQTCVLSFRGRTGCASWVVCFMLLREMHSMWVVMALVSAGADDKDHWELTF